jgi:hypothetical protein
MQSEPAITLLDQAKLSRKLLADTTSVNQNTSLLLFPLMSSPEQGCGSYERL